MSWILVSEASVDFSDLNSRWIGEDPTHWEPFNKLQKLGVKEVHIVIVDVEYWLDLVRYLLCCHRTSTITRNNSNRKREIITFVKWLLTACMSFHGHSIHISSSPKVFNCVDSVVVGLVVCFVTVLRILVKVSRKDGDLGRGVPHWWEDWTLLTSNQNG